MNKYLSCFQACILLFSFLLFSCGPKKEPESDMHLSASLVESSTSFKDLFAEVRIVPLETNEECFIKYIDKVVHNDGLLYLLDSRLPAVYVFDENGVFQRNIGKVGQGPGEYTLIYDLLVDDSSKTVELLSPFGSIYSYTLEGDFLNKKILPDHVPNYHRMAYLSPDVLLTKSSVRGEENCLSLISRDSMELLSGYWEEHMIINMFIEMYEYGGSVFFFSGLHHEVYQVTEEGLSLAYVWDFGDKASRIEQYSFSTDYVNDFNTEYLEFLRKIKDKEYPYFINRQAQSRQYHYAEVVSGDREKRHLFYDKATKQSCFFEQTTEGVAIRPLSFTDDYMLGAIFHEDKESYLATGLLKKEDVQAIEAYTEDDNPLLVFCQFAK